MMRDHLDGLVVLKVSITEKGVVENCEVKRSTHPEFDRPAVEAVQRWRFRPGIKNGQPVKTQIHLPLKFDHEA